jgi:hypothetical protein
MGLDNLKEDNVALNFTLVGSVVMFGVMTACAFTFTVVVRNVMSTLEKKAERWSELENA